MEQQKKLFEPLYKPTESGYPLVAVTYVGKDGKEKKGLMVIDSGSSNNHLAISVVDEVRLTVSEEQWEEYSFGYVEHWIKTCRMSFRLGDKVFSEPFHVDRYGLLEGNVIGILGNKFMQEYGLAMDYGRMALCSSEVDHSNLCINDCSFFMPMEPGLLLFGLPVLLLRGRDGKDHIAMADMGSAKNVIAERVLRTATIHYRKTGKHGSIETNYGTVEDESTKVEILLGSMQDGSEFFRLDTLQTEFWVVPMDAILELPHNKQHETEDMSHQKIEAVIGSPFMAEMGWVLDFKAKIIYKRKNATHDEK